MCCVDNACDGFTGCVKKDGSCTGTSACKFAFAPGGIEDSCVGDKACYFAYQLDADKKLINSCNADDACYMLGIGGNVGTVDSSCNAKGACEDVGNYATIKSIVGSCNSEKRKSCVPLQGTVGSTVEFGHITHSKRKGRKAKLHAQDISACIALCEERDASKEACHSIKWRQGNKKPCQLFDGGLSRGKCHDKNLCMTL